MIDNKLKSNIESNSMNKTDWYSQHVLSKEEFAKLIENKINRAIHYQADKKLSVR